MIIYLCDRGIECAFFCDFLKLDLVTVPTVWHFFFHYIIFTKFIINMYVYEYAGADPGF